LVCRWLEAMSPSPEKQRKSKTFRSIKWAIILLFTSQIHFVHSLMDVDGTNNMAALLQERLLRLEIFIFTSFFSRSL